MPRRRIGRGRLTEGEAGELDEYKLNPDITTACTIKQVRIVTEVGRQAVRVKSASTQGVEREVTLAEGADHAVFSGGAGINRQRHTRTAAELAATRLPRPG